MSLRHRQTKIRRRLAQIDPLEPRRLLTTWYVDTSSPGPTRNGSSWSTAYTDLQQAIAAAVSGDQIRVANGTYKPTSTTARSSSFNLKSGVGLYGGYAGYGAANPDFRDVSTNPTVLSGDIGTAGSNGDNSYHVVVGTGTSSTAVLDGFTVTAGNANGSGAAINGGGIYVASGSPTLRNCTFTANSATNGSAIYNTASSPLITGCSFTSNAGPAIFNSSSSPAISRCTFTANSGPGVYNSSASSPTILNCAFTRNSKHEDNWFGGAIANYTSSNPLIANCTFAANAANSGGAIFNSTSSPTITNCTFAGNNADRGGAVSNKSSSPTITNCIVWGNISYAGGGQIYNTGTSAPVISFSDVQDSLPGPGNVTIDPLFTRNPGPGPDDSWGTADDDPGDLTLSPASPVADAGSNAAVSAIASTDLAGAPRFQDVPTTADTGPAPVVDMGAFEVTPVLAAHTGGPYVILEGQPLTLSGRGASTVAGTLRYAWDFNGDGVFDDAAGPAPSFPAAAYPAAGGSLTISLRVTDATDHAATSSSTLRVAPIVARVDPRATNGAGNGATWADAFTDLQSALALSVAGQVIRVATGIYMPTAGSDRTVSFHLKNGVALYGGYAGLGAPDPDARDLATFATTLSGHIGSASSAADNSYHVLTATGTDATAVLDGFTVTAGNANGPSATPYLLGGGLYNYYASPTLADCTFTGNAAIDGAAVGNSFSSPSLTNCTFTSNSAGYGGAVFNNLSSSPTLSGCTFTSNTASTQGGAVFNNAGCAPLITGCAFNGNSAFQGGAIYNTSASPRITGSTLAANSAVAGGAIYNNASSAPAITNSTFAGNFTTSGSGGAILNQSASPTITGCTFSDNSAGTQSGGAISNGAGSSPSIVACSFTDNSAGNGGALSNSSSSLPAVTDCTFTRNRATGYDGGAVHTLYALTLNRCSFTANSAAGAGGALYLSSYPTSVTACTFLANSAAGASATSGGGAIFVYNASLVITNSLFVGNSAPAGTGGALRNYFATPTVVNCTFVSNTAVHGGAVSSEYLSPSTSLVNCVAWANVAADGTAFYSILTSAFAITYSDVQGGYAGTGNQNADPRFYRSPSKGSDNVWGTADDDYGDLRLLPGSPALDAGNNAAISAGVTTDLAGNPRTYDFPGAATPGAAMVDMGAYELTQDLGSLRIAAGQTVALPAGGYAFSATQVIVDPGGTLDVADSSLLIDYSGTSPLAAVRAALLAGRNGGGWDGAGIISSVAQTTAGRGVGYAEAAELGLTSFAGRPVDGTALLLKYTVAGDASLDGKINRDDYALADRGRARGLGTWVGGDFDYDGAVTAADYAMLDGTFASPPAPAPVAVVPAVPMEAETEASAPAEAVAAVVEPAPAPAQAAAPTVQAKPKQKAKVVKHAPVTKPKPKPAPKPKAKSKPAVPAPKAKAKPHAAVVGHKASGAVQLSHPKSGR